MCQSSNVNNKLVNKKLSFDGLDHSTKDSESADDLDLEDRKDYFGSNEFGQHSDIINPEYDSSNDLDKLQTNSAPFFLSEPENAFIIKSKPAYLKCKTANALKVSSLYCFMFFFVELLNNVSDYTLTIGGMGIKNIIN